MITLKNPIEVHEGSQGKLCVYWDEYQSKRYLHIRYLYHNRATGEFEPGRKGVAVPENLVAPLLQALRIVLESVSDGGAKEEKANA